MSATDIQSVLFRLSFIAPVLVLALYFWAIPDFMSMYQAFEAEIPAQTALLFKWYRMLAVSPFAFLIAWWFWPNKAQRGTGALVSSCILSVSVFLFGHWAAYAPLVLLAQRP